MNKSWLMLCSAFYGTLFVFIAFFEQTIYFLHELSHFLQDFISLFVSELGLKVTNV